MFKLFHKFSEKSSFVDPFGAYGIGMVGGFMSIFKAVCVPFNVGLTVRVRKAPLSALKPRQNGT